MEEECEAGGGGGGDGGRSFVQITNCSALKTGGLSSVTQDDCLHVNLFIDETGDDPHLTTRFKLQEEISHIDSVFTDHKL